MSGCRCVCAQTARALTSRPKLGCDIAYHDSLDTLFMRRCSLRAGRQVAPLQCRRQVALSPVSESSPAPQAFPPALVRRTRWLRSKAEARHALPAHCAPPLLDVRRGCSTPVRAGRSSAPRRGGPLQSCRRQDAQAGVVAPLCHAGCAGARAGRPCPRLVARPAPRAAAAEVSAGGRPAAPVLHQHFPRGCGAAGCPAHPRHLRPGAACDSADPLPSIMGGRLAQLPAVLFGVERRYLLHVAAGVTATMGRTMPGMLPRTWA